MNTISIKGRIVVIACHVEIREHRVGSEHDRCVECCQCRFDGHEFCTTVRIHGEFVGLKGRPSVIHTQITSVCHSRSVRTQHGTINTVRSTAQRYAICDMTATTARYSEFGRVIDSTIDEMSRRICIRNGGI